MWTSRSAGANYRLISRWDESGKCWFGRTSTLSVLWRCVYTRNEGRKTIEEQWEIFCQNLDNKSAFSSKTNNTSKKEKEKKKSAELVKELHKKTDGKGRKGSKSHGSGIWKLIVLIRELYFQKLRVSIWNFKRLRMILARLVSNLENKRRLWEKPMMVSYWLSEEPYTP